MNILVINASPKGSKSNTYQLTRAFLKGICSAQNGSGELHIEEITLSRQDIRPCLGCFSCWNKTPGKCCIPDDMQTLLQKRLEADLILWSFPLYYFSVPGGLKNFIDRQLPLVLPFMAERSDGVGNGSHPSRYDLSHQKHVLISTCGFYTAQGNYDSVRSMFDHMCGKDNYTTLFCGQGELFRVPELSERTGAYLKIAEQAGREFWDGGITKETKQMLDQPLFPKEVFERMADASWGVSPESGQKESQALIFTRQMAALYNRSSWPGKDLILEMCYTDLNERYQILLGEKGSQVSTECANPFTTRIETPYSVWCDIASGKLSGQQALFEHRYRVEGDFSLMMNWDKYFGIQKDGGSASAPRTLTDSPDIQKGQDIHLPDKSTNMNLLLLPWIAFWILAAIHPRNGSLITLGICLLLPLVFYQNKKTVYDALSGLLVGVFCLLTLAEMKTLFSILLSYLAFGLMWSISCFSKIPLTAHYSMNEYGGIEALDNLLFARTNRILTAAWGILYLLTPIWTYGLMKTSLAPFTGAINSVLPLFMGLFTAWFQKWYPAYFARTGK